MTAEEIYNQLKEKFAGSILVFNGEALEPAVKVDAKNLFEIASHLKNESKLNFDSLMCLSGIDYGAENNLGVIYSLTSMKLKHKITIRVELPRENPQVDSVESLWRTADWHEREAYDLFGIRFNNHPDLRRILCPDDWEGFPLRKDYIVQEYYHGTRVPYQEDWMKYETYHKNPERGNYVFQFEKKVPDIHTNGAGKTETKKEG